MSRKCDICGKGPQYGNKISHAHNLTRRRWNVNLKNIKVTENGSVKRKRICTQCIRTGKFQKAV